MSTEKILLVQGDRRPHIRVEVFDEADDDQLNVLLAGATAATLRFRAVGETTVLATIPCTIEMPSVVTWVWPAGVLDVPAGEYEGELEVMFGDEPHTIYKPLRFKVREQF